MPKFFVSDLNISSPVINITGEDVKHIKNVLRLKPGNIIIVSDCCGTDYQVEIEDIGNDIVKTRIINSYRNYTEPNVEITLFQGIPKSDKMDFIIQKSVELGVSRIVPVQTSRTVVKIDSAKDAESKVKRWQRISLEAAKQCNRGKVPEICYPLSFDNAIQTATSTQLGLIPYEKEKVVNLKSILSENHADIKSVSVIIGPEGGFSEDEIDKAIKNGIKPITLGPRILRTETASIALLSILMYELGDVNL